MDKVELIFLPYPQSQLLLALLRQIVLMEQQLLLQQMELRLILIHGTQLRCRQHKLQQGFMPELFITLLLWTLQVVPNLIMPIALLQVRYRPQVIPFPKIANITMARQQELLAMVLLLLLQRQHSIHREH